MIYWQCSVCGENLEAPDELIGDVVQCPSCKLSNKVPKKDIISGEIEEPKKYYQEVCLNAIIVISGLEKMI